MNLKESIELLLHTGRSTDLKVTKLDHPLGTVRVFNPVTGVAEDYTPPARPPSLAVSTIDDLSAALLAFDGVAKNPVCEVSSRSAVILFDRLDNRMGQVSFEFERHPAVTWLSDNSGKRLTQEALIDALRGPLRGAIAPSLRQSIESISVQNLSAMSSQVQQGLSSMKGEQTRQLTGPGIPNGLPERVEFNARWFLWPSTPGFTLSLELYVRFKGQVAIEFELWADPADLREQERSAMLHIQTLIRDSLERSDLSARVPVIC